MGGSSVITAVHIHQSFRHPGNMKMRAKPWVNRKVKHMLYFKIEFSPHPNEKNIFTHLLLVVSRHTNDLVLLALGSRSVFKISASTTTQ